MEKVIKLAEVIRDYHHMNHHIQNADCIVVFWSDDSRSAIRAVELFKQWFAPYIMCSWWVWWRTNLPEWISTEAENLKYILEKHWVPNEKILLEKKSTNSAENVLFTMKALESLWINHNQLILVHKPYMERRTYATWKRHLPNQNIIVTSLQTSLAEYAIDAYPLDHVINKIVWDFQRIKLYWENWFQIPQEIPQEATDAMHELIAMWYDKFVLKD